MSPILKRLSKAGRDATDVTRWRLRSWPVLLLGLLVLGLTAILWQQLATRTFSDRLLRKLPQDSYVVGAARLDALDDASLRQLGSSTNVYAPQTSQMLDGLKQANIGKAQLVDALDDQFVFSAGKNGGVFIFTVAREAKFRDLAAVLTGQLDGKQAVHDDDLDFVSGQLRGTSIQVTVARSGEELYLATSPDLIKAAKAETSGFTSLDGFSDLTRRLPGATDGYLFYNTGPVQSSVKLPLPLLGVAWQEKGNDLELTIASANPSPVGERLLQSTAKYLPPSDLAIASLSGMNISRYLHLLEEQRQEFDLPAVLSLQNGLTRLNQTLGLDLEQGYLAAASGQFVYARYLDVDQTTAWMGLLEFGDAEQAKQKVTDFTLQAQAKLTVPVRKEVVRVLPDNTQSREVVAEGRGPVAYTPFIVEGVAGQAITLPGNFGPLYFLVWDRALIAGSSPDAVARMLRTYRNPGPQPKGDGELAVRVNVRDAYRLVSDTDTLADWVLATRPAKATLVLNNTTGELSGHLNFTAQ